MVIGKSVIFIDSFIYNNPSEEYKTIINKIKELQNKIQVYCLFDDIKKNNVTHFYIISPKIFISMFLFF
jgi:hypothetical protein